MIAIKNNFLFTGKLRATSLYHLTEWNLLSRYEQELLSGLFDEAEVYGVFQPVSGAASFTSKVAYKDVALLYMHLRQANFLPRCYTLHDENKMHETISQLIFDGILEIEWNGNYVSGTSAVQAIYGDTIFDKSVIPSHLSTLSANAIEYALMLRNLSIKLMAHRLYTYNTKPMDTATRLELYDRSNIQQFLFSNVSSDTNELLQSNWSQMQLSSNATWMAWTKLANNNTVSYNSGITYKLYISPQVNDLAASFEKIILALNTSTAYCFKTGNTVKDLLRPDKMVAYFKNKDDVIKTADALSTQLKNCSVHGVPFTKQLDKKGLLSFGVDPSKKDILKLIEGGSWRSTVTDKLAAAIIQAQQNNLDHVQAINFIGAKLLAAGINTQDWMPVNELQ